MGVGVGVRACVCVYVHVCVCVCVWVRVNVYLCMWCLSADFHFHFVIRASTDAMLQYKLRALYGVEGRTTHHDRSLPARRQNNSP